MDQELKIRKRMAKKDKDISADSIFFDQMIETMNNPWASKVIDGICTEITGYYDTGSLILNGLISGSLKKGFPKGRITVLAGPESTAKTFILLETMTRFLNQEPRGRIILFETESALTKQMFLDHGADVSRIVHAPVDIVEDIRTQLSRFLTRYLENDDANKIPIFSAIDSLGNPATTEERKHAEDGVNKADLKRAQVIRSLFRVVTVRLGIAQIPMVCTNHTYADTMNPYGGTKQSGGGGVKYNNSTSIFLSKKKSKEGDDVVGSIIHCKSEKARLSKENTSCDIAIRYDTGLQRYYGLSALAIKYGIFEKVGKKIKLPDGTLLFETSELNRYPEKYYDDAMIDILEEAAKKEFNYGVVQDVIPTEDDEEPLT